MRFGIYVVLVYVGDWVQKIHTYIDTTDSLVISNLFLHALTTLSVSVLNEFSVNKQEETLKHLPTTDI
jgi:hypothetical protein